MKFMTHNHKIDFFSLLPLDPLPTHEEVAVLVHRGRRLQSQACWSTLKRVFQLGKSRTEAKHPDTVVQAPPMWSMLDRLDFDVSRLKQDEFKTKIATMTKRCVAYTDTAMCRRWLDNPGQIDAYREFCPNASAFNSLPRVVTSHEGPLT